MFNGSQKETLESLWSQAGCDPIGLDNVQIDGSDPILPSIFRVGEAAGATIAAVGAAAAELWRRRSGETQTVNVDLRAAPTAFRSERYLKIAGQSPASPWGPISGYYSTVDGRFVQLHANFPHHQDGLLSLLRCRADRSAVKESLLDWVGADFEDAATEGGLCVGLLRSREEWMSHPQGQAVAPLPLFEIERIGDSDAEPLLQSTRPLSGIKVLDLTRIIAGPVCGRTLAAHGAEVLRIGAPHLPFIPHIWLEHARGKRSAHLDLNKVQDAETMRDLVRGCDIFLEAYRPDALTNRGFGAEDVHNMRPGAIYVTLSAYGHIGPWAERRGFDSLVQTVSGIGHAGAQAAGVDGTLLLPCQALDHATGYLAAFGAMVALLRRAEEGGSYLVRVSLSQTGHWLWNLGQIDGLEGPDPGIDDVEDLLETYPTQEGPNTIRRR